jgi:polynucleotide 5'-hydroxyl-kinase GRC3/NOL9
MNIHDYPEWEEALAQIVEAGGTALLVGGTDTGKTTFCALLINAALAAGRQVAVVDGDVGQSEIGPPGCVGMGLPSEPVRSLVDVAPAALAFVGAVSPRAHLLEHAAAVRQMADAARAALPDLLVVDTTGMLQGPAARRLKHAKFALLAPEHVVALQRGRECEPILAPLRHADRVRVHRLPVPAIITVKPSALRAQRRAGRFARYFENAELRLYNFDDVVMTGTWLNTGPPLAPHLLRFASNALGVRVYHAEECDRQISLMTSVLPESEQGIGLVQEQFRAQAITLTPAPRLRHLLTGLADGNGRLLGIGLIESLDLRRRQIGILTPIRAPAAVRLIHFGILRVRPDGTEVGANRPGDV